MNWKRIFRKTLWTLAVVLLVVGNSVRSMWLQGGIEGLEAEHRSGFRSAIAQGLAQPPHELHAALRGPPGAPDQAR